MVYSLYQIYITQHRLSELQNNEIIIGSQAEDIFRAKYN